MSLPALLPRPNRYAILGGMALLLVLAVIDVYYDVEYNATVLFPAILMTCWWTPRRRWVWLLACTAMFLTVLGGIIEHSDRRAWLHRSMSGVAVLVTALAFDSIIRQRRQRDVANDALEAANRELAAREEETARQNEELQSQAGELERQSEEMRVVNDELSRREKLLEAMLDLSRTLTVELSRESILQRLCNTFGQLIGGEGNADGVAILEQRGEQLHIRCHYGLGGRERQFEAIAPPQSFAALVIAHGKTGYLEDVSLRPDLRIAQPADGDPFVSVLATPLRVGGEVFGAVEVYSRQRRTWDEQCISMLESIATQASVSIHAADLFESVARERARFETVLRALPVGTSICNADMSDIRLNPMGATMLALPAETNVVEHVTRAGWLVYRGDGTLMHPTDWPMYRALHECRDIPPIDMEIVITSGRRVSLLTGAAPFRDGSGKVVGAVASFTDVTPLKGLQRELDARRREAEEASLRKTRFLAAVSHDIRTPANAISLLSELIRRAATNPTMAHEVPELARELHSSASSLASLLGDMLDMARFDTGRIEIQETEFVLGDLLNDEYRRMLPLARERDLTLEVSVPTPSIRLRADRIKLARIIDNLIGNAIKFTEKGKITLDAVRSSGGQVDIRVHDTGIGIDADQLETIFDEFVQLRNPERDRTKGTGLGLTICRRLVDAMGGELNVRSKPGEGSTFLVTLPASVVLPDPT